VVQPASSGAAYQFELELLSADVSGGVMNRVDRNCAVCTIAEANDAMSKAAEALPEIAPTTVKVDIKSDPPGAAITIDGKAAGAAPLEAELAPGEHKVRAMMDGYSPSETDVVVAPQPDNAAQEVKLLLVAVKHAPPPVAAHHEKYGVWKWVAASGGVALLTLGIVLVAIDGDGTGCAPGRPCKELYDTALGGVLAIGGGLVAGGASGWMFVQDRRERAHHREVGVVPARGGAEVVVGWSW
jgi:hypothetical protein